MSKIKDAAHCPVCNSTTTGYYETGVCNPCRPAEVEAKYQAVRAAERLIFPAKPPDDARPF